MTVAFDIWVLVMFPVIDSSMCVPWSVMALMTLELLGVGDGCGVVVAVG